MLIYIYDKPVLMEENTYSHKRYTLACKFEYSLLELA